MEDKFESTGENSSEIVDRGVMRLKLELNKILTANTLGVDSPVEMKGRKYITELLRAYVNNLNGEFMGFDPEIKEIQDNPWMYSPIYMKVLVSEVPATIDSNFKPEISDVDIPDDLPAEAKSNLDLTIQKFSIEDIIS